MKHQGAKKESSLQDKQRWQRRSSARGRLHPLLLHGRQGTKRHDCKAGVSDDARLHSASCTQLLPLPPPAPLLLLRWRRGASGAIRLHHSWMLLLACRLVQAGPKGAAPRSRPPQQWRHQAPFACAPACCCCSWFAGWSKPATKRCTVSTNCSGHSSWGMWPQASNTTSCRGGQDRQRRGQLGAGKADRQGKDSCREQSMRIKFDFWANPALSHLGVGQQRGQAARVGSRHQRVAAAVHNQHSDVVAAQHARQPLGLGQVAGALQTMWQVRKFVWCLLNRSGGRSPAQRSGWQGWVAHAAAGGGIGSSST